MKDIKNTPQVRHFKDTYCETEQVEKGSISLSLEQLDYCLKNLEENLSDFFQKISPILRNEGACEPNDCKASNPSNNSALNDKINQTTEYVRELSGRLSSTTFRVDL